MQNDLLGVVVEYVAVQFLQKKTCVVTDSCCVLLAYLPRSCFVLVAYNKTNISCLLCLLIFNLSNVITSSG